MRFKSGVGGGKFARLFIGRLPPGHAFNAILRATLLFSGTCCSAAAWPKTDYPATLENPLPGGEISPGGLVVSNSSRRWVLRHGSELAAVCRKTGSRVQTPWGALNHVRRQWSLGQ